MTDRQCASSASDNRLAAQKRGVSDVLAFVLMFSIIITGVGLISFGAYDNLTAFSEREQVKNGERGMMTAAATLDDLHRQSDTKREFKLTLSGGEIFLNESAISVSSPNATRLNETYSVRSLEHRFDRDPNVVTVRYEAGGVFRSPGASPLYRPSVRCTDDMVIVSIVQFQPENFAVSEGYTATAPLSPQGIPEEAPVADLGRSLIFDAEVQTTTRNVTSFPSSGSGLLHLNVSRSATTTQWERYLDRPEARWTETGTDGVWECGPVDRALVRTTTVNIEL